MVSGPERLILLLQFNLVVSVTEGFSQEGCWAGLCCDEMCGMLWFVPVAEGFQSWMVHLGWTCCRVSQSLILVMPVADCPSHGGHLDRTNCRGSKS